MKNIAALFLTLLILATSSCVIVQPKHDNGKHKGWYKNPNNPHHPNTTNPGHTKQKEKGKGKSK